MAPSAYRAIIERIKGNLRYQPVFERLVQSLFLAMNCGPAYDIRSSGEFQALQYVQQQFQLAEQPLTVFDVGANVGEYAAYVLEAFELPVQVFAFEPGQRSYQALATKFASDSRVQCLNYGLGSEEQTFALFSEPGVNSKIASLHPTSLKRYGLTTLQEEVISLKTVDGVCQELGIGAIAFLKIDVEGHELEVLKGAAQLIAANAIRYIQFEFGPCNLDSRTYFRDFFELLHPQYRLYRIVKNGLFPIEQYKELYEIFYVTNYLAELR